MASMRSTGSTPGKGEGEGDDKCEVENPVSFIFTPEQTEQPTKMESTQSYTEPGSAFSLSITVTKVKEQIKTWQPQILEAFLCCIGICSIVMQIHMFAAIVILLHDGKH